jgi:diacylglycerol kinase family enzyme
MLQTARNAVRDKIAVVAVGGGDGSVNAVASTLLADPHCQVRWACCRWAR